MSGRPFTILGDVLSKLLLRYPFASLNFIAKYFCVIESTEKDLLIRELRLRKFTGKWENK
jgi:hypothetical protein